MQALETSKLITDEYSAKIILATMSKPRSAFELSEKLGIPIAACYRKIKVLEKAGMIFCSERTLTQTGKRISLFKSRVRNAQIIFEKNKLSARIAMVDGTMTNTTYEMDLFSDSPLC